MIGVNKRVPHFKIENYLKNLGINYTILRASFFMQNLSNVHGKLIKEEDDLIIDESSLLTGMSNGDMLDLMKEYGADENHITLVALDLPI